MTTRTGQTGAAAVEFALILPVFLFMSYGMVVYAYMFVLQESLTYAAQVAAESTIRVDPALGGGHLAVVQGEACAMVNQVLAYLPDEQKARVPCTAGNVSIAAAPSGFGDIVTVELTFNFNGLFPVLSLPGLGDVPPMPDNLSARAVAGI